MPILIFGGLLIIFGLFSMYSVSIFESFDFTRETFGDPSNYYYFLDQLQKLVVGLVLSVVVYFIPLKVIKKLKYVIFALSIILVALLFTKLTSDFNAMKGARLWITIGGNTIQPGEFFKVGFVFFLSSRLIRKKKIMDDQKFFVAFALMVTLCLFIFVLLPDFGSLLVLGPVALILYWYSGGKGFYVVLTLLLGVIGVTLASLKFDYVQDRLTYFVNPSVDAGSQAIGWQTQQSLIAVGGGGWLGNGYGKGLQKFGYIPEAQSDFIFAAFSEEIGFLGNLMLLGLYCGLGRYVLIGLQGVKDEYDRMLGVGLLSLILMQAFINIGVNIKIIPLTGLTLPFVSHGGSALLTNMLEVVLLYKIVEQK